MELATAHYERLGATVRDCSSRNPYDLQVSLAGEVRVE